MALSRPSRTGLATGREAELDTEPAPPEVPAISGVHPLVGTLLADRYRIDQLLGEGGMGQVYRAEHVHMRKAVALKVLHRELTAQKEIVARFEREAVAAARIEHPHVAAATDFGRLADGSFYLVLEFVEGKSLTKLMATEGRLPVRRALAITRQIGDALSAAHEAGIVHRDLKPDNVMLVAREQGEDFVKVLDFGIAKVQSEDTSDQPALTKAGTVFGTPEYMAPEQARGAVTDARADLYTLGMMLYEMLSGKTAFHDPELIVVLTRQMTKEPPPLPADVDVETQALVMTLLAKDPDERIQTAAALCDRIDALLGGPRSSAVASQGYSAAALVAPVSEQLPSGDWRERVGSLTRAARAAVRAHWPTIERLLRRPIRLGSHTIPAWIPLVSLLSGCLLVVVVAASGSSPDPAHAEAAGSAGPGTSEQGDSDDSARLDALVAKARAGDGAVLAELRELAGKEPRAWLALGNGYARVQKFDASVEAYAAAVELDATLAGDPGLVADVHAALRTPEAREGALKLAETLGAPGADLVYDLWLTLRADPTQKAAAPAVLSRLERAPLQDRASPALKVALELNGTKSCAGFKKIMPAAAEHADQRALGKLQPLTQRTGCGFLGLRDCYSCLRGGSELGAALARARREPGPSFGTEPSAPAVAPAVAPAPQKTQKSSGRWGGEN
ncbi:MAG TPA: protein kinase [Polyangiaceae bacterium]